MELTLNNMNVALLRGNLWVGSGIKFQLCVSVETSRRRLWIKTGHLRFIHLSVILPEMTCYPGKARSDRLHHRLNSYDLRWSWGNWIITSDFIFPTVAASQAFGWYLKAILGDLEREVWCLLWFKHKIQRNSRCAWHGMSTGTLVSVFLCALQAGDLWARDY